MTENPESANPEPNDAGGEPTPAEPEKKLAEETRAEPYNAAASNEPTIDAQASDAESPEEEDPEFAVPGDHPWAVACHLGVFANAFCLLGILVPLLIREKARSIDPEVEHHAKEALNFQLNVVPLFIILTFLAFSTRACPLFAPAILGLPVLMIATVGYAAVAAMKASEGKRYRYPFIKRLID